MCCHSNRMFGAGDRHQLITATGTENTSIQDGKTIKHPIQAIRGKPLMERVDRNKEMQLLLNRETNRFGEPLLGYLKKIFPDWDDVTTKVLHGTDWFPIFIDHNVNLAEGRKSCPNKEISRESSMFVSVLTMLGLECVVNNAIADREILVICYLNLVVLDLEAFLKLYLEPMCEFWHELIFGKNRDVNYQYWRLKESIKLQILGPMNARGKTAFYWWSRSVFCQDVIMPEIIRVERECLFDMTVWYIREAIFATSVRMYIYIYIFMYIYIYIYVYIYTYGSDLASTEHLCSDRIY